MSDDTDRDAPRSIQLANELARHLDHEPDPAAAFLRHLDAFWEPRMHAQLDEAAPRYAAVLHPVARQALHL